MQDYATLDVLPGYRLSESWLLYLRGGITYAHMTMKNLPVFDAEDNRIGGRVGAGFNLGVSENLGLAIDYFYTQYQDKTLATSTSTNLPRGFPVILWG